MPNKMNISRVADLKEEFSSSKDFIVTDYRGLTVKQITELRGKLREFDIPYKVVKNNLSIIALKEVGVDMDFDCFKGPTSVAFTGQSSVEAAKVLVKFQKETTLDLKAAFVDNVYMNADELVQLSKLPGKRDLLAQIAGGMNTIVAKFVGDLETVVSGFGRVLKALEDKQS